VTGDEQATLYWRYPVAVSAGRCSSAGLAGRYKREAKLSHYSPAAVRCLRILIKTASFRSLLAGCRAELVCVIWHLDSQKRWWFRGVFRRKQFAFVSGLMGSSPLALLFNLVPTDGLLRQTMRLCAADFPDYAVFLSRAACNVAGEPGGTPAPEPVSCGTGAGDP